MAQHDYVIANGTGAAVRSDLNNALAAIVTQNSGATAPATTYAYQWWADTTTGLLKLRNAANNAWITLFQLDGEWSTLAVENGSAAAPSIYFKDSGTDTGIYSPGADQVAISTGGTGRLFVSSAGLVGIGTSSPQVPLDLISDASGYGIAVRGRSSDNQGSIRFTANNYSAAYSELVSGATYFALNVNSAERLRVDSSGRLGIGTQSPQQRLSVSKAGAEGVEWNPGASSNLNTEVHYNRSGSAFCGISTQATYHVFDLASSEAARIDTSGRLLVGTSSYAGNGKLIAAGNTGGNAGTLDICWAGSRPTAADTDIGYIRWYSADNSSGNAHYASIYASSDGASSSGSDIPGRLVFSVTKDGQASPSERMRLTNDGRLFVGYTSSANVGEGVISAVGYAHKQGVGSAPGGSAFNFFWTGSLQAWIDTSNVGNVTLTSDYRIKKNIASQEDAAIPRIKALRPVTYERGNYKELFKEDGVLREGFIAHELAEVIPSAVEGEKDAENQIQSINIDALVSVLTKAFQEAVAKIETLEAKVAALETA